MDTQWTIHLGQTTYRVNTADPSTIPVKSVADALVDICEARANVIERERQWHGDIEAIERARNEVATKAAQLAIKKKELPKNIRQTVKDAEDAAALSEVMYRASEAAFLNCYSVLTAEFNANKKALVTHALKGAELALTKMASARKSFELAAAEAFATYGLLGMFAENEKADTNLVVYRESRDSRRAFATGVAIEAMGEAVGNTNIDLTRYRNHG